MKSCNHSWPRFLMLIILDSRIILSLYLVEEYLLRFRSLLYRRPSMLKTRKIDAVYIFTFGMVWWLIGCLVYSINQSISQSINQSISHLRSPPPTRHQSINQPINLPRRLAIERGPAGRHKHTHTSICIYKPGPSHSAAAATHDGQLARV